MERKSAASNAIARCEDLLVGDDSGYLYYYSIEWPDLRPGMAVLLLKLDAHSQNICGIAWSSDGSYFVSGGNDNMALVFNTDEVLRTTSVRKGNSSRGRNVSSSKPELVSTSDNVQTARAVPHITLTPLRAYVPGEHPFINDFRMPWTLNQPSMPPTPPASPPLRHGERGRSPLRFSAETVAFQSPSADVRPRHESKFINEIARPSVAGQSRMHKYAFFHSAAVKAMAFAPWQSSLLATGGGSNDRQIHFHHTGSGTTLAVINVFAQVTGLVWSTTRREIAATFGYAQPEHDVRIAVFAWPSCECVVSIPWERKTNGEIGRALSTIPYPGGPNDASLDRETDADTGFRSWERLRASRLEATDAAQVATTNGEARASTTQGEDSAGTSAGIARLQRKYKRTNTTRGEGEVWASRTEEEGSLIVACCDQTVKFFEVWAGKSKGRTRGIGAKAGVLGGSKVLEGWCNNINVDEVGPGEAIR